MEASIDGVKAISTSLYIPGEVRKNTDFFSEKSIPLFENAAKITLKIIKILINYDFGDQTDLISINIPYDADAGSQFQITRPFRDPYGRLFHKEGDKYIHMNPILRFDKLTEGTDLKAISDNKISITPICLELVAANSFEKLNKVMKKSW
jgi:5'/3'-nucleotidase SurE